MRVPAAMNNANDILHWLENTPLTIPLRGAKKGFMSCEAKRFSCSQNQEEMATQKPYHSGFTLATFDPEAHNWSQEDCDAYAAFLLEDRTQAHLQEALEQVLESQRLKPKAHIPPDLFGDLSGDELMDMFWK